MEAPGQGLQSTAESLYFLLLLISNELGCMRGPNTTSLVDMSMLARRVMLTFKNFKKDNRDHHTTKTKTIFVCRNPGN